MSLSHYDKSGKHPVRQAKLVEHVCNKEACGIFEGDCPVAWRDRQQQIIKQVIEQADREKQSRLTNLLKRLQLSSSEQCALIAAIENQISKQFADELPEALKILLPEALKILRGD
ncbi:MAG: hypothetical protein U0840_21665 [Gemmataceae bacterium]